MTHIEAANKIKEYRLKINRKRYYDIKKTLFYKRVLLSLNFSLSFTIFSLVFTTTSLIFNQNLYTGLAVILSLFSVVLSSYSKFKFKKDNKEKLLGANFKFSIKELKNELKNIKKKKEEYALYLKVLDIETFSKALSTLKENNEEDLEELENFLKYKQYNESNIGIKNFKIASS